MVKDIDTTKQNATQHNKRMHIHITPRHQRIPQPRRARVGRGPDTLLTSVHVVLWGDRSDTVITGCESCDRDQPSWSDFLIEYWFERIVGCGEGEFKLVEMTTSDRQDDEKWL